MPLFIASVIIQVALVIHIVKTGRNTNWIWIVVMLPLAGSIAYFILEVLPDIRNSRAGRSAGKKVRGVVNPDRDINQAVEQFSQSDTIENSVRLADQCYDRGMYTEARQLYQKSLRGQHASDPDLLHGLARSDFALENYADVKATLDRLIEANPDYKNQDAHLLYARTLEKLGEMSAAQHEYEVLHDYFSGPDASYYYATFLKSQGQVEQSDRILRDILDQANSAGKHYHTLHREIIRQVKAELSH